MSLDNNSTPVGRRVRWIAIGAGAAALIAIALMLATRQYNAHAPNESPPGTTVAAVGAGSPTTSKAGSGGGGPASATSQNLIPGMGTANVIGPAVGPALGVPNPGQGGASPGFAETRAPVGSPGQTTPSAPVGSGAYVPQGASTVTYPPNARQPAGVATPGLPFPAVASPPSLSPMARAAGGGIVAAPGPGLPR